MRAKPLWKPALVLAMMLGLQLPLVLAPDQQIAISSGGGQTQMMDGL